MLACGYVSIVRELWLAVVWAVGAQLLRVTLNNNKHD